MSTKTRMTAIVWPNIKLMRTEYEIWWMTENRNYEYDNVEDRNYKYGGRNSEIVSMITWTTEITTTEDDICTVRFCR